MDLGGHPPTLFNQTPNTIDFIMGVSLRGISFVDEREIAQTAS